MLSISSVSDVELLCVGKACRLCNFKEAKRLVNLQPAIANIDYPTYNTTFILQAKSYSPIYTLLLQPQDCASLLSVSCFLVTLLN